MVMFLSNNLYKIWWKRLDRDSRFLTVIAAFMMVGFLGGFLFGGCGKVSPANPAVLFLRPGQSAVILEDISVLARIPAQGEALYEGPVMIERGTVALKPIVE